MDKKNAILGSISLLAAMLLMWWSGKSRAEQEQLAAEEAARERASREVAGEYSEAPAEPPLVRPAELLSVADDPAADLIRPVREAEAERTAEDTVVLENAFFQATFTSRGGALRQIALTERNGGRLAYPVAPDVDEPVILYGLAKTAPLSLAQQSGSVFLPLNTRFDLVSSQSDSIVFEAELPGGVRLRRTFSTVEDADNAPANYTIRQELALINPTDTAFNLDQLFLNLGTAAPTNADPYGMDLNASVYEDGSYHNVPASKFKGGWFSSAQARVERAGQIQWGAVKNQFFVSLLTPETPAQSMVVLPVEFPSAGTSAKPTIGVTAFMRFDIPTLAPGATETIVMDYYAGPKDFHRLKQMPLEQEDVMHFGWFLWMFLGLVGFVAKSLFTLMSMLHGFIGNWGFAIIALTLIVRLLLWPLTAKAARSSKRMQELQKPMQELKEKYKDNPRKQQEATLELFRKHKINPFSSCWPMLIQFPIFIGMFNLLRNTADLRFADFLWIEDLSMPDRTIPLGDVSLPFVGSYINILPFFWLVSMWFQMRLMPQPSVDNAQTKIIKFFPFLFFPATYFFSSGLVLYWTTTNCFSIFQGWITHRRKDAEDIAIEQEIAESEQKKSTLKTTPLGRKKKKKNESGRR